MKNFHVVRVLMLYNVPPLRKGVTSHMWSPGLLPFKMHGGNLWYICTYGMFLILPYVVIFPKCTTYVHLVSDRWDVRMSDFSAKSQKNVIA